ncbi:Laminin subunit alpha-2 [Eufriesea mexicana]|uniref:Laminin subunit alpha-2 n=1 Tax=Eufriesea mexicana TaxID=516756 RepID=A0A310SFJ0_9HYME|nr:Laminin subunit alpha-2 [Eufriesea mexicana]
MEIKIMFHTQSTSLSDRVQQLTEPAFTRPVIKVNDDVPPPGSYDPKIDSKVKGFAIEKSERFHDNKSIGSAEYNLSVCTKNTSNIVASFRTPQLPRKHNGEQIQRSSQKVKPRALISANDQKLKYNSEHQLADLQVECSNKDKTIQELERHVEDLKQEVRKLELELDELQNKQAKVEEQHRKDIETMVTKLQQEVLHGYDERHQTEVKHLRCQLSEVSEEKEREIEARKIMEGDLRNRIADFSKRIVGLESELAEKKYANTQKVQTLEAQIEELTTKLETITVSHKHEINLLEQEKTKLNSYISDLTDESDQLELKLQQRQNVIFELQAQLSTLQCELDELKAEYENLVENSSKQMDSVKYKYQEEIDKLKINFEEENIILVNENQLERSRRIEIEAKVKDVEGQNKFLVEGLVEVQELYNNVRNSLHHAQQELEESNEKHNLVLNKHKVDLDYIMKRHDEEAFKLKQYLENEKLKERNKWKSLEKSIMEKLEEEKVRREAIEGEMKTLSKYNQQLLKDYQEIHEKYDEAVSQHNHQQRIKHVSQLKDKINEFEQVNAMFREARITTLDEKLAQKDVEITRLSVTLEALKSSAETQESFGQSLQMELDRAETELAEKKGELRALKDQIRAEAAEMVARRKRFEVIMSENQSSVAALTKRLSQSNAEVERLQHELKRGEDCINEHRDLLSIMRDNSQMVHEQVHVLMQQLDAKKGLVDQFEAETLSEVETLKVIFENKIDDLRKIATMEVAQLQAESDSKTAKNVVMKNQLHEMANHLAEAQTMLLKLEERNDVQEVEISRIELLNSKLNEQLNEREIAIEEINKLLKHQSKNLEVIKEANLKIQELTDKIESLEEKDCHMQENYKLLEEERNKWKNFEKAIIEKLDEEKVRREAVEGEMKTLSKYNQQLLKDYQEIREKYVEVVDHHNHQQRIKHVSQLKDKISQLEQDLHVKMRTIEQQQKIIEKLKAEEKCSYSKGKENMVGIPKSTHTTPVSSPHKLLTPLRNRNE